MTRRAAPRLAAVFLATVSLVALSAVAWGWRMADYDTFHIFFGAITVFATPVAAVAIWTLWLRLRAMGRLRLILCALQLEVGILPVMARLQQFGPGAYPPIPLEALAAIRSLPDGAKLAYSCKPDEEFAFWIPRLMSIYAHTGRRVVPMCYESDVSSVMIGADPSIHAENPVFRWAPQRSLYSDRTSQPSTASIAAFLKEHNVRYIYADAGHPNSLVPGALGIGSFGDVVILVVP
jgi:hypothetical protein